MCWIFITKMKFLAPAEVPAPDTELSDAFLTLACVNESISSAVCIRSVTGKTTMVLNVIGINKLLCQSRGCVVLGQGREGRWG